MKTVSKKLLSLLLVAMLLVSAVPFQAFAATTTYIDVWVQGSNGNWTSIGQFPFDDVTESNLKAKIATVYTAGDFDIIQSNIDGMNGTVYIAPTSNTQPEVPEEPEVPEDGGQKESTSVTVYIYEMNEFTQNGIEIGSATIDPADYANTDAMVKAIYNGAFSKYKYRDFGDGTAQLQVWPIETPDNTQLFKLRIQHNDGTSDYTLVDIYEGASILDTINAAGVKLTYADHTFVGWSLNHTGTAETYINRYHTAEASMANSAGVIYIYADWDKKTDDKNDNTDVVYDVVLKIYTNGKISSAAKTVSMDNYGIDGKITRQEVELCVKQYYKGNLNFYGLFTAGTWNNGKYDVDDAVSSINLNPDKPNTIYVMVKNATPVGSGTADPSNPKTGDVVLPAAMTMMMVSGLAAAAVYVIGKKRRV